jgi:hypothetical protein
MEGSLYRVHILLCSITKHGSHRQFLFLIGRFSKIFSSETACQMNRNLVGSIYGMSSMKIIILSRSVNKHGYHQNLVGLIYGMSSMKITHSSRSDNKYGYHRNLVGSIYGISSMKIAHFVPIG